MWCRSPDSSSYLNYSSRLALLALVAAALVGCQPAARKDASAKKSKAATSDSAAKAGAADTPNKGAAEGDTSSTTAGDMPAADTAGSPPVGVPPAADSGAGTKAATDSAPSDTKPAPADTGTERPAQVGSAPGKDPPGKDLYVQHCAACHGDAGDAQGIAATFLYPKPRNFRVGHFRLVSTKNNVPSWEDLDAVLVRGMPGSSMPPWAHLQPADRRAIAEYVISLRGEGIREEFVKSLRDNDGLTDAEIAADDIQAEIRTSVQVGTTAGETSETPAFSEPDDATIARGKDVYVRLACKACHGEEGKGDGVQAMIDDQNLATAPRDFTLGIFKGGHDPAAIYRRVAYGMPGTPMPATANATPEEMVDLSHFIRSLSTEEMRQAAVLKRTSLTAMNVPAVSAEVAGEVWNSVPVVELSVMALWWRSQPSSNLRVQAAHDAENIAIRVSWDDATPNARAILPDEFEDMLAVELSAGAAEPFLGMGTTTMPIDLWHWRGGLKDAGESDQMLDDYPFDGPNYRELLPADKLPDFITARAAGNPIATRSISGGNLNAAGPGSSTFRPAPSQLVTANGAWSDGKWTVVFVRSLKTTGEDGVPLAAGQRCSVAFAKWDGAANDRASQKLITIWNDLQLE